MPHTVRRTGDIRAVLEGGRPGAARAEPGVRHVPRMSVVLGHARREQPGENCPVPLFSKHSVPAEAAPLPRLHAISDPEREWIRAHVELVTHAGTDPTDLAQIRAVYERSIATWRRINPPERDDPNVMINAIGMTFGQHLIGRVPLEWMIAEDDDVTELALYERRHDTLVYPANLVAKRWVAEELSGEFLVATADRVVAILGGRRRSRR